MLDVHPPHQAAHTWSDFFIHIATIVVGLLIAVGMEQTVEYVHRSHERTELRASLREESRQIKQDTESVHLFTKHMDEWLRPEINAVQDALIHKHAFSVDTVRSRSSFVAPNDPAWMAAKSSGIVELLTQDEIKVFSEEQANIDMAERYHVAMNDALMQTNEFRARFMRDGSDTPDYSWADTEDLKEYLKLLLQAQGAVTTYIKWCHYLHGDAIAILNGEHDLQKLEQAEEQSW